jgi:putative copper export protein
MTLDGVLRFVHLLSAATWVGGLIVLGSIAAALRRAGTGPDQMRAMARAYGRVAWPAMVFAVVTGFWQAGRLDADMGDAAMVTKMLLVVATVAAAGVHQLTARLSPPAFRGAVQGLILLLSLATVAAAVAL